MGLVEQGKRASISREQGIEGQILKGTKTILGNREHRKQIFNFGEQENKPIYFRVTREQVHPPPPLLGRASKLDIYAL